VLSGDESSHRVGRVSPGEPLHLVTADRHRVLDWDAAHHGVTVHGTPATQAIPSVPRDLLRRVVLEHLRSWPGWLAGSTSPGFHAYAVLTVSRAAAYLGTGDRCSKRQGAVWAATRWPQWRSVTGWAVRWWYEGGSDADAVPPGVAPFVSEVAGSALPGRVLEPMQERHLDQVVVLQEEGSVTALGHIFPQGSSPFPRAAVRGRWAAELTDAGIDCFVIRGTDSGVQGFAATRGDQLLHFGTARSTWGSGLARLAHDELLDHLRGAGVERARLWVFEENHHARHFYEHRGWTLTDERKRSGFAPHPALLGYVRDLLRP
jgi:RimJ/RimL family protein N-acetyltransferase